MDPACPSYHGRLTFSPRTLIQRRTLGLAVKKKCKTSIFKNWHLKCPYWVQFSAILVRPAEEMVAAIPLGLSRSFAWLLHANGPPGRAHHSTSFIRAYLLPCNHHKACQETKWTICDRAPSPTQSKFV